MWSCGSFAFVYANVRYPLDEPVSGAGYYYGSYTAQSFNLSSLLQVATAEQLTNAEVRATRKPSLLIEDFAGDWEKEWFTYRPDEWARATHKLNAATWKAPPGAVLSLSVQAAERNKLVVLLDTYAAKVQLAGGDQWQQIMLRPSDFHNHAGEARADWSDIRQLKLSPAEHLRAERGGPGEPRLVGKHWQGPAPAFRNLRWQRPQDESLHGHRIR